MHRPLSLLFVITVAALLALVFGAGQAFASGVDPASYSNTLTHGQSVTITKTVHTPAIPPKVDIMFLADTTGSMGPAISNVQTNAASILTTVRGAQPDTEFGAANYRDFSCPPDPFAYQLNQGITGNLTDAQNGINAWSIGDGCDIPEAQINALFQVATQAASNFRAGSTRVVVWFGDSSGHDPSGGITLAQAIAALQAAHIEVIAIPVSTPSGDGLDSTGQATAIAAATGGQVLPSATSDQVSAAILSGLSNLPVAVTPVPVCGVGLSATYDAPSKTVVSGTDATFLETLTVATDAPEGGTLHCNVDFLLNGNHQDGFQQVVNIDVPEQPITATGGFSFSGTEPASVSGIVATFTDPDTFATAGEYSASIDWGDGSLPSSGTITGGSGSFSVSGNHIYTEEGSYTITVKITDIDNAGNSATVTDSASVADAALTATCASVPNSLQAFNGAVANLVDANPIAPLSDFTATIDWGDSSTSAGTLSGSGPFTVSGSHTYGTTGFFTITTSIKDVGGSTASTACKVLVFAFAPGGGSFVIGDNNSATGTSVTFWGAQWWKLNSLTGGAAPASFKGFALNPTTPACGTGWSTDPGNSAPPPAGPLPAFMGVIVSSSISKSGPQISGDTPHIVIVQTNPGYAANPGHAGTGTVVAQFC